MITSTPTAGGTPRSCTSYCYGTSECLSGGGLALQRRRAHPVLAADLETSGAASATVSTQTGTSPDPVTEAADYYFQGMNGDEQSGGGTASATLAQTSSRHLDHHHRDRQQPVGRSGLRSRHLRRRRRPSGHRHRHHALDLSGHRQPSPSPAACPPCTPTSPAPPRRRTSPRSAPADTAKPTPPTSTTRDGRVTSQAQVPDYQDNGAPGDATEDTCTQTTYATDSSVFQTDLPAQITVTAGPPASLPGQPAPRAGPADLRHQELLRQPAPRHRHQRQPHPDTAGDLLQRDHRGIHHPVHAHLRRVRARHLTATDADGNTTTTRQVQPRAAGSAGLGEGHAPAHPQRLLRARHHHRLRPAARAARCRVSNPTAPG